MANKIPPKTWRIRRFSELFCLQHGTAVAAILNLTSHEEGGVLQLTYVVTLYHMYVSEFQQLIIHTLINIFHADFKVFLLTLYQIEI